MVNRNHERLTVFEVHNAEIQLKTLHKRSIVLGKTYLWKVIGFVEHQVGD
jgi:hypothetical protein